jgi:hypothetical protein
MEHLMVLDTSYHKFQPGSGSSANTNPTLKDSSSRMYSQQGCTVGAVGTAQDAGLTSYKYAQANNFSRECPNSCLMKTLLNHVSVYKEAQKVMSGQVCKDWTL